MLYLSCKSFGSGRRDNSVRRAQVQLVAKQGAQPGQNTRDGRLAEGQTMRRAGYAALFVERVKGQKKGKIERSDIAILDKSDPKLRLD